MYNNPTERTRSNRNMRSVVQANYYYSNSRNKNVSATQQSHKYNVSELKLYLKGVGHKQKNSPIPRCGSVAKESYINRDKFIIIRTRTVHRKLIFVILWKNPESRVCATRISEISKFIRKFSVVRGLFLF